MRKLDLATVGGLLLAVGCLALAVVATPGASLRAFCDLPSFLVVFGGCLAAATICFPLRTVLNLPNIFGRVLFNRPADIRALVTEVVSLGEVARRQGLLALEKRLPGVEHPFLRMGLQLAVDGTRPEVLSDILRTEVDVLTQRHRESKGFIDQLGRYAPAFGMIGTLLGLIFMLGNLTDPTAIGSGMAVALVTTLYGAVGAYAVFLPCSEKLQFLHKEEMLAIEIAMRGIAAIQAGESPRVIEQKLELFLPEGEGRAQAA